ncbi:MAG: hypothetical protein CVU16_07240 [Betaproteobacteria bacterium HGW-Betaproteobacteria-10]|nr:MAG: hypothetical protein CVU16_07240 [Betaproteobacteria bacterium HGW-Betaproteobacteria-10]
MTKAIEESCARCGYCKPADAQNGTRHRVPPGFAGESSPRETHHWRFPAVSLHAWCGEFRPSQPLGHDTHHLRCKKAQ